MTKHTTSVADHTSLQGKRATSTTRNCLCGKRFTPKNINNTEELCPFCEAGSAVSILDDNDMDDSAEVVRGFNVDRAPD